MDPEDRKPESMPKMQVIFRGEKRPQKNNTQMITSKQLKWERRGKAFGEFCKITGLSMVLTAGIILTFYGARLVEELLREFKVI